MNELAGFLGSSFPHLSMLAMIPAIPMAEAANNKCSFISLLLALPEHLGMLVRWESLRSRRIRRSGPSCQAVETSALQHEGSSGFTRGGAVMQQGTSVETVPPLVPGSSGRCPTLSPLLYRGDPRTVDKEAGFSRRFDM